MPDELLEPVGSCHDLIDGCTQVPLKGLLMTGQHINLSNFENHGHTLGDLRHQMRETQSMSDVVVSHADGIATVTLNRPDRRNALSEDMMRALTSAFVEVGASDARGVILAAEGPVFSAGHDFRDMAGSDLARIRDIFTLCTRMMRTIHEIPQPVIARVHALATAAGCQLVATCDLAIAADTAGFAIPGGKAGLFCHTPLVAVARNISRKRAMEMALTGDPIDAATAADWGLINRAVPAEQLDDAVQDLITRATRGSELSKSLGKRGFYAQIGLDEDQAYAFAIELMSSAATTADAQEGMAAFLDKRHPNFTQR